MHNRNVANLGLDPLHPPGGLLPHTVGRCFRFPSSRPAQYYQICVNNIMKISLFARISIANCQPKWGKLGRLSERESPGSDGRRDPWGSSRGLARDATTVFSRRKGPDRFRGANLGWQVALSPGSDETHSVQLNLNGGKKAHHFSKISISDPFLNSAICAASFFFDSSPWR